MLFKETKPRVKLLSGESVNWWSAAAVVGAGLADGRGSGWTQSPWWEVCGASMKLGLRPTACPWT